MHKCPSCGTDNPQGMKFCGNCAARLVNQCSKCGFTNLPSFRFCGQCGTALGADAVPSSGSANRAPGSRVHIAPERSPTDLLPGERKTVTALFADIKGSTNLMAELDPEEARALVDPALRLMIDAVHRYDGYIVQSTGDGIFALFGAPVAHEDHAHRGLYAALKMQSDMRKYSARLREAGNAPIEIRIGLNSGEVVVRSIRTADEHTEYTPIGHTANLAARMQTLAPTGSIAVTEAVHKLAAGYFDFAPLGPARVKGVSEPVNVYEVRGLGALRTRLQISAQRGLSRFIGRQHEIEQLKRGLSLAQAGRGQVIAVIAEAGVGKSRLFHEFKAMVQDECFVMEAFSVSHARASAYLPVVKLLKSYFRIADQDDDRTRREKITGKALALDRSLENALPHLFALLRVEDPASPLSEMDPTIRRRRTREAIKNLVQRESLNQTVLLIFEDLHWIDAETQALLDLLVESIGTARILMMVNYRPEYQHHWGSKTYYTQLRLDPLERARQEVVIQGIRGPLLATTQGFASSELSECLNRGVVLCQRIGEGPEMFMIMFGLCSFHISRNRLHDAENLAQRLLSLSRLINSEVSRAAAYSIAGSVSLWRGEFAKARAHLEKAIDIYDQDLNRYLPLPQASVVPSRCQVSWTLWMLGCPEQARARSEEALELAHRLGHPFSIAFALMYAIALAHLRRDHSNVRPRAEALLEIARENGFPYWSALASMAIGRVLVGEGNHDSGLIRMREAMSTMLENGGELMHCYALSLLAESYLTAREPEKGLATIVEALQRIEASGQRIYEAEVWRLRGELLVLHGSSVIEAERSFERALKVARGQQARSWELRGATSFARFLARQDRHSEAKKILAPVLAGIVEGRTDRDFQDATGWRACWPDPLPDSSGRGEVDAERSVFGGAASSSDLGIAQRRRGALVAAGGRALDAIDQDSSPSSKGRSSASTSNETKFSSPANRTDTSGQISYESDWASLEELGGVAVSNGNGTPADD